MKPIDKVLAVRRNAPLKSPEPMRAFHGRLKQPRLLLEMVQKDGSGAAIQEMRRLYCVALSAAFELYWRDLLAKLIKKRKVTLQKSPHLGRISFTLLDIHQILGRKLTLGELIASSYSFQTAEVVNQAVSEVLGIQAFSEFRVSKFQIKESRRNNRSKKQGPLAKEVITGEVALRRIPLITKCFEIRHDTVHDSGVRHRITQAKLLEIDQAVWMFNVLFGLFATRRFVA